jgi:hypothetical protein
MRTGQKTPVGEQAYSWQTLTNNPLDRCSRVYESGERTRQEDLTCLGVKRRKDVVVKPRFPIRTRP